MPLNLQDTTVYLLAREVEVGTKTLPKGTVVAVEAVTPSKVTGGSATVYAQVAMGPHYGTCLQLFPGDVVEVLSKGDVAQLREQLQGNDLQMGV